MAGGASVVFGLDYREEVTLNDGTRVVLRLLRPEDRERLRAGFERLSPQSRYRRFLGAKSHLSDAELHYLTDLDHVTHLAIGAARLVDGEEGDGVGVARFVRLPDGAGSAEAAVAVLDDVQGQGLGRILLSRLIAAAKERGVTHFRCSVIASNGPMRALLGRLLPDHEERIEGDIVWMDVPLVDVAPPGTPAQEPGVLSRLLAHAARGLLELRHQLEPRRKPGPPREE